MNAAVAWSSSAPDQVSVDATGRVTARAIGSAMVFATSGGVKSPPVFIVVAEPPAGTLLVTDAQVLLITPPAGLAAGQMPGIGTTYEVRLAGVATPPAPGTVVLSAENSAVAGKVVSTRSESGALVVTLALAPLRELFSRYSINWSIDLAAFPAVLDLTTPGSSAGSVSPAARLRPPSTPPAANFIQPFSAVSCEASLAPVLLSRTVQLAPTADLRLDVVDDPGYTRRAVVGSFKTVGTVAVKLNAGFKFSGKCLAQVLIRIPIGGPLALGIMPGVRVGVGVGLDGEIALTAGELSITGEVGTQLEVGWECGGITSVCRALESLTPIRKLTPKYEVVSPRQGMRVKLSGQLYALVGLDAVFFTSFTLGVVEARVGPVQSVDLGFEEDQVIVPTYASTYDLKLEAVVEPGSGLQELLNFTFGPGHVTFQGKASTTLSESPKGVLSVSQAIVPPSGVSVDLRVDLTNTDYFGIGYNVRHVVLWRKKPNDTNWTHFRDINVTASNQTVFTYTWQPTLDDLGTTEFAALVYSATDFPVPGLEVSANSIAKVLVSCFSTPRADESVAATSTCSDTWQGTATFFQPDEIQIDVSVTWTRNPRVTDPGLVRYMATGTATVKWIRWNSMGCSVSETVFPINEDDGSEDGGLSVDYGETPPAFGGLAVVLFPVTVTCPGGAPGFFPLGMIWLSGSGNVSANGTLIQGRNDVGGGIYWSWSFARP